MQISYTEFTFGVILQPIEASWVLRALDAYREPLPPNIEQLRRELSSFYDGGPGEISGDDPDAMF